MEMFNKNYIPKTNDYLVLKGTEYKIRTTFIREDNSRFYEVKSQNNKHLYVDEKNADGYKYTFDKSVGHLYNSYIEQLKGDQRSIEYEKILFKKGEVE